MSKHEISGQSGLSDLLQLFADNVTVSDIIASNVLGNISASIVEKRIQSDMTQQEFANHMCVSQGMVSKWEGGDYNFTIRTLADIAEKLDMDLTVKLVPNKRTVQVKHI
ncbi:MAG: helix-turn-helix domain-containing protein [Lachnospiraceae bacterium]|nr:helix-turn-helix domain-containing protein [Butyrivibrio sp.]MCM1343211.1 helix-turn-helix domain-containing protein [Muribaculaceae bacterium]MCM1409562.1 helix-turn-helix domain-containing protein [Lachnospiraceae bacterium]